VAPWFYFTFFLAPAPTEPVLVPFPTESACYAYQTDRLEAWSRYVERNRDVWVKGHAWEENSGYASWMWIEKSDHWPFVQSRRLTFRLHAGPLTVFAECLRREELSPESLKSLRTSP
jgi:hypothetical protein